jgi:anhydro-N-acetylmuramic acid kinase
MRVSGLISGTSVDGIDVAVVDIGETIGMVAWKTIPYPLEVRDAILSVSNAATHTATIARLNFLLGELFAEALQKTGVPLETIELIGSHGQTIFHEGEPTEFLGRKIASTMQIGEAAVIADRTGIETIADFRTADMAAGGKGAPLVPFLD